MLPVPVLPARVLVVDDDPAVARVLKLILEAGNYEAAIAHDGRAALEQVESRPPDLVVCDLDMPELSGLEVCRSLKQNPATRFLPVLILTGRGTYDNRLQAWEVGADDFLSKPFQTEEVLARCRALLRVKRLTDELDSAEAVVFAFVRAVEAKCRWTLGHSERVTTQALALGRRVGLSEAELAVLHWGGLLHDIGKIHVPDAILNKPEPLTAAEFDLVKQHPTQGARIVEPLRSVKATLPLIRWHHERLNGRGYPDGLAGDAIPLLVRVLSVADVYDAMASNRPYRTAIPHADCLRLMAEDAAGGGLDGELVRLFAETVPAPSVPQQPSSAATLQGG